MPGMITKEMLREKTRQIVKAEKAALLAELDSTTNKEETKPEEKKMAPPFPSLSPKKKSKAPTAEELALEQKRKMAEAVRAVIKSGKEDQLKAEERKKREEELLREREREDEDAQRPSLKDKQKEDRDKVFPWCAYFCVAREGEGGAGGTA